MASTDVLINEIQESPLSWGAFKSGLGRVSRLSAPVPGGGGSGPPPAGPQREPPPGAGQRLGCGLCSSSRALKGAPRTTSRLTVFKLTESLRTEEAGPSRGAGLLCWRVRFEEPLSPHVAAGDGPSARITCAGVRARLRHSGATRAQSSHRKSLSLRVLVRATGQ